MQGEGHACPVAGKWEDRSRNTVLEGLPEHDRLYLRQYLFHVMEKQAMRGGREEESSPPQKKLLSEGKYKTLEAVSIPRSDSSAMSLGNMRGRPRRMIEGCGGDNGWIISKQEGNAVILFFDSWRAKLSGFVT